MEEEERKSKFGRKYFHAKSLFGVPTFLLLSVNRFHRRDFPIPPLWTSYYAIVLFIVIQFDWNRVEIRNIEKSTDLMVLDSISSVLDIDSQLSIHAALEVLALHMTQRTGGGPIAADKLLWRGDIYLE